MTTNINGIDVNESVLTATNNDVYYSQNAVDELQNNIKRLQQENEGLKSLNDFNVQKIEVLQEENEKIKKQYNCYACGNCNGTEDYINLEKHHKGLRKQFDELAKRNNTLSLRIEELEKENEELKNRLKTLDDEEFVYEVTEIEYNNFKKMNKYKQALEEIRSYCDEQNLKADYTACYITNKIDEVLNDV